ncbi:MAG: PAS domain-containing protein, partial [Microcoleaceae cyanobacterium]
CRRQSSTALSLAINYHNDRQEITLISNSKDQSQQPSLLVSQILGTKPVYSFIPSLPNNQADQNDQNQQKLLTQLIGSVIFGLLILSTLSHLWSQRKKLIVDLQTEKAKLQQQQEFLAKTITASLITLDEKYLIQKINQATNITFEYPETELLGKNIDLLIPGFTEYLVAHLHPSADGVNQPFAKIGDNYLQGINQQKQTFPIELTVTYWQEKTKTFYLLVINSKQAESLTIQALKAEHKELENIVTNQQSEFNQLTEELLKEVAERHQTQRELQQTKEQLEVILRGISDGITVLNQKGEIVYVNQAAKRASNYTSLLVQNFQQFPLSHGHNYVEITNEKGEVCSPDTLPHHLALLGQEVAETVLCYTFWQGDRSYEIVKATPILREEKVRLVIIVTHDITARKKVEEALRA